MAKSGEVTLDSFCLCSGSEIAHPGDRLPDSQNGLSTCLHVNGTETTRSGGQQPDGQNLAILAS